MESYCVKSVQIRSFFWSVFSCIRTPYSVETRENTAQKKLHIWTLFTQYLIVIIRNSFQPLTTFVKTFRHKRSKEFLIPFWAGPTFEHFDATFTKIGSQSEYVKICSEIFCKIHRKTIVESFRPSTLLKRESLKILKNFQNNYFVDHLQTAAFLPSEITPNSVIFQITET